MEYQRKSQSSNKWKAIIITFSVIGAILLGGGLAFFLTRKKSSEAEFSQVQRQQVNNAVLSLAGNL